MVIVNDNGMHFMQFLKDKLSLPWCMIWDFNDMTCHAENEEGWKEAFESVLLYGFNSAFSCATGCSFYDLGLVRHSFTWEKCLGTPDEWIE